MTKKSLPESIGPFIDIETVGHVAVFRLKDDVIDMALDLERMGEFWDALDLLEKSAQVRALLLIGSRMSFSPARADQFLKRLWLGSAGWTGIEGQLGPVRLEENATHRLIDRIRYFPAPVIIALQGDVTSLFLGLSLACDYRVAGEDTVFHIRCCEAGLPPAGGLCYFLPRYVGWGPARRLILEAADIDSRRAHDLGLVDVVAPTGSVETLSLECAEHLGARPSGSVWGLKTLMNAHLVDLGRYLEEEQKVAVRMFVRHRPRTGEQGPNNDSRGPE